MASFTKTAEGSKCAFAIHQIVPLLEKSAFIKLFTTVVPSDTVSFALTSLSYKHVNRGRGRHKHNKHDKKKNLDDTFTLEDLTSGDRK